MATTSGLERHMSKTAYTMWAGVFVAGLLGLVLLLTYATRQIDYIWRWYKIPRYFISEELIEIKSEIQ